MGSVDLGDTDQVVLDSELSRVFIRTVLYSLFGGFLVAMLLCFPIFSGVYTACFGSGRNDEAACGDSGLGYIFIFAIVGFCFIVSFFVGIVVGEIRKSLLREKFQEATPAGDVSAVSSEVSASKFPVSVVLASEVSVSEQKSVRPSDGRLMLIAGIWLSLLVIILYVLSMVTVGVGGIVEFLFSSVGGVFVPVGGFIGLILLGIGCVRYNRQMKGFPFKEYGFLLTVGIVLFLVSVGIPLVSAWVEVL